MIYQGFACYIGGPSDWCKEGSCKNDKDTTVFKNNFKLMDRSGKSLEDHYCYEEQQQSNGTDEGNTLNYNYIINR